MTKLFRLQEGWLTVGLLALLLFSVTLSIEQAQWADGLSILTPITVIGLVTGIITAKVRGVPRFLLDVLGLEVGIVTVLLAVTSIMHDPRLVTVQDKVQDLLGRSALWVNVAVRQDVSDDLVVFVLSLAVVAWVLAYSSAYFVFRSRQLWWALVPNGVALLINLSYFGGNLNGYIVVFAFSALLLMIRFNLLLKEERWQRERVNYSPALTWSFLWAGSIVSVVLALAMWWVPASAANTTLNGMWDRVNRPWEDFQGTMSKLWAIVPGNQNIGGFASFNKSWTMGGSLNLSDAVALKVRSPERFYLRVQTSDEYTGQGNWTSTAQDTFQAKDLSSYLALDANQQLSSDDDKRLEITYTVQVVAPSSDLLFTAPRPIKLSSASRLDVSWHSLNVTYKVDCFYTPTDQCSYKSVSSVPLELRGLIGPLHQAQEELHTAATMTNTGQVPALPPGTLLDQVYATSQGASIQQQINDLQKRGIVASLDIGPSPNFPIQLHATGEFPIYDDVTGVHAPDNVQPGLSYTAASLVSNASEADLRAAGTDYDQWLKDRYVTLPASTSDRIKQLAQQIVADAGATNPYDEGKAIETYLRDNYIYSTSPGLPPTREDPIEYFLFDNKQGYCEHYAGAFVIMMRSLDVPTRIATGFAPGNYDPTSQIWTIRESSAHAWPEVYFPGYGWIQYEPTPSQSVQAPNSPSEPTPAAASPTVPTTPEPSPTISLPSPLGHTDLPNQPLPPKGGGLSGLPFGIGNGGPVTWIVLGAVLLLLVAAAVYLLAVRQRKAAPVGTYYGRMIRLARLLRLGPAAHQTPFEFSETLAREFPGTGLFARTIARAYVKERYSREQPADEDRVAVNRAYSSLRARLVRSVPMRQLRRGRKRK